MIKVLFLFSFLIALSFSWLASAGLYLHYRLGLENLLTLNPSDLAIYICAIIAPIAIIWLITGFSHHIFATKNQSNLTTTLLYQARRSSEHTEALVKAMIEIQAQTRSGVLLNNIPIVINHLNEVMSQIAMRFGILTTDASERLWEKVSNGNLWAFCRVLIDNAERTPNFKNAILKQANKDKILSSAIIEFCRRFENLQKLLANHDRERLLAGIVEEGSLGKVFALIKPLMIELSFIQDAVNLPKDETKEEFEPAAKDIENEEKFSFFKNKFAQKKAETDKENFAIKANIKKIDDFIEEETTKELETQDDDETFSNNANLSPNFSYPPTSTPLEEVEEKKTDFTFFGWHSSESDNEKKTSKLPKDGI